MDSLAVTDLGENQDYGETLSLQERLHARRKNGDIPDTLLLLEHSPVYTLGRSAEAANMLMTDEELRGAGIAKFETRRGGDVTYHGPGQLVGYPIVHLAEKGLKVLEFVEGIEETLLRAAAAFGVAATRAPRNRGVWINDDKLAALGIMVSRQVTMHGFALNVNTDLSQYRGIVPCGLQDAGVTSLARELGREIDMPSVKKIVAEAFRAVFGYR
ncbi:MAG: lipoyl(octanoyl) transferase LipB [Kiritimatiellae bacterium]|nr:lipoyl(octanoyl) transferase LipB [Kiritimatiellia bacterium]